MTIEMQVESLNQTKGNLQDYDCKECSNKGLVYFDAGGDLSSRRCKCIQIRRGIRQIKDIGEKRLQSLDDFVTKKPFQEKMLSMAKQYLTDNGDKWFFIGGQTGCGKSHICTAILREIAYTGKTIAFMPWVECVRELKKSNFSGKYYELIDKYLKCDVLYIDDLFKKRRTEELSMTDVSIAFEIINHREQNSKKTLISSELSAMEIVEIDEALGSRIIQMSQGYRINIGKDRDKNFRLEEN